MDFPEFRPEDNQNALEAFYSKHQLDPDGYPTPDWERENLTKIQLPYPLTLPFAQGVELTKIRCHKRVAQSLIQIFELILEHFGSIREVQKARMHLFGGGFNFRMAKGCHYLSTHAWGAGIDLDPERNPYGLEHDESRGMIPLVVVSIFEEQGWQWGGRFSPRPDCMHFQATR